MFILNIILNVKEAYVMLNYKKIIQIAKSASKQEKEIGFKLGAPWVYCDNNCEHIIYEYKNGAKEIRDMSGNSIEIIPPKGI